MMLTPEQIEHYREDGFILVENVFDRDTIAGLRRATDGLVERSRAMDIADFDAKIVRGESTLEPRVEPVPVRIPLPRPANEGSIYENQAPVEAVRSARQR